MVFGLTGSIFLSIIPFPPASVTLRRDQQTPVSTARPKGRSSTREKDFDGGMLGVSVSIFPDAQCMAYLPTKLGSFGGKCR